MRTSTSIGGEVAASVSLKGNLILSREPLEGLERGMCLDPFLPSLHCPFLSPSDFISISVRSLASVTHVCMCLSLCEKLKKAMSPV